MPTKVQLLWQSLLAQDLVSGNMPEEPLTSPWPVRIMQGFAGWLASLFFIGFIASILGLVFEVKGAVSIMLCGFIACSLAYAVFRLAKNNEFLNQSGLVFNLCGQLLVSMGLSLYFNDFWSSHQVPAFYFLLAGFLFALVFIIPNFISRIMSTCFAFIALIFGLNIIGISGVGSGMVTVLFVLCWLHEPSWGKMRSLWEPIALGLAISVVFFNAYARFGDSHFNNSFFDAALVGAYVNWIYLALICFASVYVGIKLFKQYDLNLHSKAGIGLLFALISMMLLSYYIPSLSDGILLVIVGFSVQRNTLITLGIIAILSFFSWYYYQLEQSLLLKSSLLMVLGVILFAAAYLGKKMQGRTRSQWHWPIFKDNHWRKLLVISTGVLILLLINNNIYQKEQLLNNGQLVLLKLAPVDPRSIMQGDYMRLNFDIERMLLADNTEQDGFSSLINIEQENSVAYFVVKLDEHSVGTFSHIDQGKPLEAQQVKMQYRVKNNQIYLATHAFFFQEGSASQYENALYGAFRVSKEGELLLTSLIDKDYRTVGINKLEADYSH